MKDSPKETILSIATENRILRWVALFMSLAVATAGMSAYRMACKPQIVWLVTNDGRITNNNGLFFSWEAEETARKCVEIYYLQSAEREQLLTSYFSEEFAKKAREEKLSNSPVGFRAEKVEQNGNEVNVTGTVYRSGSNEQITLTLIRSERSENNPFGLIAVSAKNETKRDEPGKQP